VDIGGFSQGTSPQPLDHLQTKRVETSTKRADGILVEEEEEARDAVCDVLETSKAQNIYDYASFVTKTRGSR